MPRMPDLRPNCIALQYCHTATPTRSHTIMYSQRVMYTNERRQKLLFDLNDFQQKNEAADRH